MKDHFKAHVLFYLGLAQVICGWLASVDFRHLEGPAIMLSVSGLVSLIVKYVQANLDDPEKGDFPTLPVKPAQQEVKVQ